MKRLAVLFKNDKDSHKIKSSKKRILSPDEYPHTHVEPSERNYRAVVHRSKHQNFTYLIPNGEIQPLCKCSHPVTVAETRMKTLGGDNSEDSEGFVSVCQCGCPIDRSEVNQHQGHHNYCGCPSPTPNITDVSVCECGHKVDPSYLSKADHSLCSCTETSIIPCDICAQPQRRSSVLYGSGDLISGSRVGESAERHAGSPDFSSDLTESVSRVGPGCWPKKRRPKITVKRKPITRVRRKSGGTPSGRSKGRDNMQIRKRIKKPKVICESSSGSDSKSGLLPRKGRRPKPNRADNCIGNNKRPAASSTDTDSSLTSVSELSEHDVTLVPRNNYPGNHLHSGTVSFCKCNGPGPDRSGFNNSCCDCSLPLPASQINKTVVSNHQMAKEKKVKGLGLCCSKVPDTESNTSSLIETAILNNDTTICKDCKISAQSDQDVSFCKCHESGIATSNLPVPIGPAVSFMQPVQFTPLHSCTCPRHANYHRPLGKYIPHPVVDHQEYQAKATNITVNEAARCQNDISTTNEGSNCLSSQHSVVESSREKCPDCNEMLSTSVSSTAYVRGNSENTTSFSTLNNNESGEMVTLSQTDPSRENIVHVESNIDIPLSRPNSHSVVENRPVISNEPVLGSVVAYQPLATSQPIVVDQPVPRIYSVAENQPMTFNLPVITNQPVVTSEPMVTNQSAASSYSVTASQLTLTELASPPLISNQQEIASQPLIFNQSVVENQLPLVVNQPVSTVEPSDTNPPILTSQAPLFAPLVLNSSPVRQMCRFCSNHTPCPESEDLLCELCTILQNTRTPDIVPVPPLLAGSSHRSEEFESPTWLRDRTSLISPLPAINRIFSTTEQGQYPACDIVPISNIKPENCLTVPPEYHSCDIVPVNNRAVSPIYRKDFSRQGSPSPLPSINEQIQRSGATSPFFDYSETNSFTSLTRCSSLSKRSRCPFG